MSLCHDRGKSAIIALSIVGISRTVGIVLTQYAHGIIINGSYFDDDAYLEKLKEIKQYCLDHTDRILAGGDPVKDLIIAGMIRSDAFQDVTCQNVDSKILWTKLGKGENLKGALGID